MTTFNTGNAVPSADARDRFDNSQTLDEVINGTLTYYANRVGSNVMSLKGMETLFNAAQLARANEYTADKEYRDDLYAADKLARDTEFSEDQVEREEEFDAAQDSREVQFNTFMDVSGYEPPIAYAPGILLDRTTKTVSYLGAEYRAKGSFIPLTTSNWATDAEKLKLIGDDSLRQDLASPTAGAGNIGYNAQTVKAELDKTLKDAAAFFATTRAFVAGDRVTTRAGETWDIVPLGSGDFNHPNGLYGLIPAARPSGVMYASQFGVSTSNSAEANYTALQLALDSLRDSGAGMLELPFALRTAPIQVAGRIRIPAGFGMRGSAYAPTVLSFTTENGGVEWSSSSILEDVNLRGNNIAQDGLTEYEVCNRVSGRRVRIEGFTRYNLAVGMNYEVNNSLLQDFQCMYAGVANIALGVALNITLSNCNTNLADNAPASARGIKVYDRFPGGTANQKCRNTTFIKGIFERGSGVLEGGTEYQVEVENASQLLFIGSEFNGGHLYACKVRKGSATLIAPHPTLNGIGKFLQADEGTIVNLSNYLGASGSGGLPIYELISGPVLIDGNSAKLRMHRDMRWYDPGAAGVSTFTRDPLLGTRMVSSAGTAANRMVIAPSSPGLSTAGRMYVYVIEVAVTAITSGVAKAYLAMSTTPFRVLGGTLALGLNTFSVVSDKAIDGAVDIIGDAAFDITILTVSVKLL